MRNWVMRKLHVSWHIAAASFALVIGMSLAKSLHIPELSSLSWLLTGTSLLFIACTRQRGGMIFLAIFGGCLIGMWRGSIAHGDASEYGSYEGRTVTMIGTVSEDSDLNERGQLVLRLRQVEVDANRLQGAVWVTANTTIHVRRSDRITLSGKLSDGFGSFRASMYGAQLSRVQRMKNIDPALDIRDTFAEGVQRALSEPQSSLGLGYVVGQRRGLPEELDQSLRAAGLTHIVVASGYNLTILVRLARRLFERISKYLSFITSAGMILGFVAITGISPSMARAGLVTGLSLIAWYYGRRFHPLFLLPFTMAITVLVEPSYAWGDLGWQLSFAAFAGVMILAPLIRAYFFGLTNEQVLLRIFIETMSATVATLPILLLSFGHYSLVGPIANMAILPLIPFAMLTTFIAGLAGLLIPAVAVIISTPAELLLRYMVFVAEKLGGVSWAIQDLTLNIVGVVAAYGCMVLACIYMQRVTGYDFQSSSIIE